MNFHDYHALADDFYYGDDYYTEAYGPTARDAAFFGETDAIITMIEDGDVTEAEGRAMLEKVYANHGV